MSAVDIASVFQAARLRQASRDSSRDTSRRSSVDVGSRMGRPYSSRDSSRDASRDASRRTSVDLGSGRRCNLSPNSDCKDENESQKSRESDDEEIEEFQVNNMDIVLKLNFLLCKECALKGLPGND